MSLLSRLVLRVTGWGWVRRVFTHRFGRRVAMRFVAVETLDDAVAATRDLNDRGFTVSLDHLGEHVAGPRIFGAQADHPPDRTGPSLGRRADRLIDWE